jgi:hypothetical protein
MTHELFIRYLAELKWPIVLVILLLAFRKPLGTVLASMTLGSKVKISLFGVEVDTTLQELENVSIATLGGSLDANQKDLLTRLGTTGPISYNPKGIPEAQWCWIRPLRNAGLVETQPQGEYLAEAQALQLTSLGSLMMKAINA